MEFNKALLWSILDKYDGIDSYVDFCNSLSKVIQENYTTYDIVSIFQHLILLSKEDSFNLNLALGEEMNSHLFEIM